MLKISGSALHINGVLFCDEPADGDLDRSAADSLPPVIAQCVSELTEYFNGARQCFNVPVHQEGTAFQKSVWNELLSVPFGKTMSYLELSRRLGNVKAIRAAASTNGKNQIAIIVPCHRIIGSNHDLVGYGGGLSKKRWLLAHEAKVAHGVQTLF